MTPDELRELAHLANKLAREMDARERPVEKPDKILNSREARRLTGAGLSTLYRWARESGCGWKTESGQWRFSRNALLKIISPGKSGDGEFGENGECSGLLMAMESAQVESRNER